MKKAPSNTTLDQLPIGARLLVRSRVDWRFASVSSMSEELIVLNVCSPGGRTYRLRRAPDAAVSVEGPIPILINDSEDHWRDNFSCYDIRW